MGIFDRFYYGKAGKRDYSESDMPKNRLSLFFLVLKDHLFDLVKVNLLQVVFWIPFFIWTFISFLAAQEIGVDPSAQNAAQEWVSRISGHMLIWLGGAIPCIAITGPSTAGAAYVLRNWSKDQHAFLWSDYRDAIKNNWKQALPLSIITGAVPAVLFSAVLFYGRLARGNAIFYLPFILTVTAGLVFCLMLVVLYPMMVGYELKFRDLLKNAFLMALAQLPKMMLARLITAIPVLALFMGVYLGNGIVPLAVSLYYLVFGLAFTRLVYASFSNAVFDVYLNPHIEGATVGAGLRPAQADDYEEDEETEEDDE